jgi:spoIIIJ-associated protein
MNDEEVKDEAWDDSEESEALDEEVEGSAEAGEGQPAGGDAPVREGGRGRGRRSKRDEEVEIQPSDARSKQALEFVVDVVREMELDCRVRLRRPKDGDSPDEINIEIIGRDAGLAIGKKGQVLQALQFLTHRVVNRPGLDKRHVLVDAEGYRSRRDDSLANMAQRLGGQAVKEGKIITFEPMNPRDRRVVHMALAKFEGVITKSEGEGEDRRVQIIPVRRPTVSDSSQ